jgi:Raf kinase inhibitor-like YbhB/YbcL family protein
MELRSIGCHSATAIPRRFTGEGALPPLHWANAPSATRSFVLLCDDPDAPTGIWHHWTAYDIPAEQTELRTEGGSMHAAGKNFKQAINDFRKSGYGGPCPPRLHGIHRYHFRLLALSVDQLSLGARPSCRDIEREARKHAIAEATLIGLYQR